MKDILTHPISVDRLVAVAVDVQHDFIDGSLAVKDGEQVVEPINALTSYVRRLGGVAVFTRDWHPENTAHFDKWPVHCVQQSEGAAFHNDLRVYSHDIVLSKGTSMVDDGYSGFEGYSPDGLTLEAIIRPHSRYERVGVIIGGLATDYCDLATVIDATKVFDDTPNVHIAAVSDAMRAVDLAYGDGDRALEAMQQAGALVVDARSVLDHQVFIKEDRA